METLDARTPTAEADLDVVGDSYSHAYGLDDDAEPWTAHLGEPVEVHARSGAGYTRAGLCDGPTIGELADDADGFTIVQAGLNDVGADGLAEAAADVAQDADVMVGPTNAPTRADEVQAVDATLATVAAEHGVTYVSVLDLDLPFSDGLHLTPEGHKILGEYVAAQLP